MERASVATHGECEGLFCLGENRPKAWEIADVQRIRLDLTDEQALDVLEAVHNNHNADYGVDYDTLEIWVNALFPQKGGV